MSNQSNSKTDLIKSLKGELLKEYVEYDGLARKVLVYQTPADTLNNGLCLITQFVYDGTTTRLTKKKESIGKWLAVWDIV